MTRQVNFTPREVEFIARMAEGWSGAGTTLADKLRKAEMPVMLEDREVALFREIFWSPKHSDIIAKIEGRPTSSDIKQRKRVERVTKAVAMLAQVIDVDDIGDIKQFEHMDSVDQQASSVVAVFLVQLVDALLERHLDDV